MQRENCDSLTNILGMLARFRYVCIKCRICKQLVVECRLFGRYQCRSEGTLIVLGRFGVGLSGSG